MSARLARLQVLERLEVGPVQLEPDKLTVPYTVVRDGESATHDLVYRYDEPVFDPANPRDVNLASLIGAQVALNYGLFCRELVFHGPFDATDRRLIRDMAANTAREIYVNKLLKPNPFLVGAAVDVPVVVLPSYLLASLRFDGEPPEDGQPAFGEGARRIAVLASGGKESLCSQGLLEEIGWEVHALFAAESGRHWMTAMNGFRHLQATRPTTARVWTTCDRLFNFMLRQLPIVRPDYDKLRADDYPIRLWTVAVFLFGVLPLLKKRRIGRLVVGDEYDTTVREHYQGIPHYAGLFDQSRFFDETLSRYFHRKGWALAVFSVLRPVSELTIEHMMATRYPDLMAHRVSCHAAHVQNGRAYPCGRCEKCRRVVGMLVAQGLDPGLCGYGPEQVTAALGSLGEGRLKQAAEGDHLAALLLEQGKVSDGSGFAARARRRSEVVSLRFDAEASPPNAMPRDLREPLWRIMLDHVEGAVQKVGRGWRTVNALAPDFANRPYPFEGRVNPDDRIPADRPPWILGELTWPQAKKRFDEVDVALLPVGAVEQHGPHLPLDIDAWDARHLAMEAAAACPDPKPLVLPLIPYGVSYHHAEFSGTLDVAPETLARFVYEVGLSAARNGVRKLIIVNGHGGNQAALGLAAQAINRDAHVFVCVDTGESSDAELAHLVGTPHDVHAGEYETSTALATRPELVYLDRAVAQVPSMRSRYLQFGSSVAVDWHARTHKISPDGTMGDPTQATVEKGRAIWDIMIRNLAELVEHLKGVPIEELLRPDGS